MIKAVKAYVGLYLSDNALSAVQIRWCDQRYLIEHIETTPLYGGKIDFQNASSLETLKQSVQRILLKFQAPFEVVVLLGVEHAIKRTLLIDNEAEKDLVFQDIITGSYIEAAPKYDALLSEKNTEFQQTAILAKNEMLSHWRRLISAAGFSLFGIDAMPLCVARMGRLFSAPDIDAYIILSVDYSILDISVIRAGDVVFSYTLAQDVSALLQTESGRMFLLKRWEEVVNKLGDNCPKKVVYVQSSLTLKPVFSTLNQYGPVFDWIPLEWASHFDILGTEKNKSIKNEDLTLYFWPLSAALAVFDTKSQPLLFYRRAEVDTSTFKTVKRRVFQNIWVQITSAAVGAFLLLLLLNGLIGFFDSKVEKIVIEKQRIEQSPVYQNLKQQAVVAESYVAQLSQLRDRKFSTINLVNTLVEALPEDVVFETVDFANSGEITLKLQAYSNTSIYSYFSFIESKWGRATLSEILKVEDAYLNEMYEFAITFSLRRKGGL